LAKGTELTRTWGGASVAVVPVAGTTARGAALLDQTVKGQEGTIAEDLVAWAATGGR
jgi:hypothetical protein